MNETIALFQQSTTYYLTVMFLVGLCVGSFLNVVIYRYPISLINEWRRECVEFMNLPMDAYKTADIGLAFPGSHCPLCNTAIPIWYNIPILSYLFLRGKCAECDNKISLRYPFIELFTACITVFVAWHFGFTSQAFYAIIFTWAMIAISGIDIDHQLIPDTISLPLLWIGMIANCYLVFCTLRSALWGAIFGYLSLWLFMHIFRIITGKIGMGHGDFKLFAVFGAWVGWQMLPLIIIQASIIGTIVGGLILFINKSSRDTPIPFGPYLAVAGWVSLMWREPIMATYMELFSIK